MLLPHAAKDLVVGKKVGGQPIDAPRYGWRRLLSRLAIQRLPCRIRQKHTGTGAGKNPAPANLETSHASSQR